MSVDSHKPEQSSDKTVLVVEDNDIVRLGFAAMLKDDGYRVVTACDGRDAIECLHDGVSPDLILLDMMMPPWDGWWFLAQREQDPTLSDVPVLITSIGVTGHEWAQAHGCAGFVEKPVQEPTLLAEVRRCCR
jgi:chemotaxis family two-component system sensor histidine kinase/response regulator PixL